MSAREIGAEAAESVARMVAGIGGPVGVTLDHKAAPIGTGEWLVYRYGLAPTGLATMRQLSAMGLRPGGCPPVAALARPRGRWVAYLYDVSTAKAKRPMTPAKFRALAAANRARRICPTCGVDAGYVIPFRLGECVDCHYGPADETPSYATEIGVAA
ncbi:RRQRL motif-containing zinc-binding protein [Kineosporia babensis]|uniref:Uncharacterized protein n=1 Tax=Kineosporia babensis TaxID=499548 RepID=A0A9X1NPC0_9ACTN|nr:RRQRL motif-containing zinc-binding protein [Kineosporia babensis]MCD5317164.1 hypothetical protein [Kineosporia babensis]